MEVFLKSSNIYNVHDKTSCLFRRVLEWIHHTISWQESRQRIKVSEPKNHQFVNSHFTHWQLNHRITSFIPCFMQSKGSKQLLVSQLLTLGIPVQSFHQPLYFDTVLSINTLHQSLMHKKIAPLITKHEVPTQKWVWWVLMSLMCSCSSTACPLTGLEGQLFGMRIVVEEEEELVEVVALRPTPQAYSLTPVVEQSEVATSRTWNRKGNINIRITFNLMHNNHQLLKNLALYVHKYYYNFFIILLHQKISAIWWA